jgi:hypothetical protein
LFKGISRGPELLEDLDENRLGLGQFPLGGVKLLLLLVQGIPHRLQIGFLGAGRDKEFPAAGGAGNRVACKLAAHLQKPITPWALKTRIPHP